MTDDPRQVDREGEFPSPWDALRARLAAARALDAPGGRTPPKPSPYVDIVRAMRDEEKPT